MTCEVRNAGMDPNMSVTARVSKAAKLNNRRSNGSHSRAGFVTGLIRLTTKGAAHHANAHPAAAASSAIQAFEHHQSYQPRAAGAKRNAHCHLAATRFCLRGH